MKGIYKFKYRCSLDMIIVENCPITILLVVYITVQYSTVQYSTIVIIVPGI